MTTGGRASATLSVVPPSVDPQNSSPKVGSPPTCGSWGGSAPARWTPGDTGDWTDGVTRDNPSYGLTPLYSLFRSGRGSSEGRSCVWRPEPMFSALVGSAATNAGGWRRVLSVEDRLVVESGVLRCCSRDLLSFSRSSATRLYISAGRITLVPLPVLPEDGGLTGDVGTWSKRGAIGATVGVAVDGPEM